MIFYQNVGHHILFQEKGMALGKRGIALEEKGMAPRHAKTGKGKGYIKTTKQVLCFQSLFGVENNV